MLSSRGVRMFPVSSMVGDDFLNVFEDMWDTMNVVSRLPNCLVTGDFPPTNILVDDKENYIIQMSVTGYPEEGVELNFKDNYLTVIVTPDEKQFEGYKVKMRGMRTSKAERKFLIPSSDFDVANSEAAVKNGMLTIKIPRREEAKPISIKVKNT